jgi:arginase
MKGIIIQGLPYDAKSSWLKGASLAPPLIRSLYHSDSTSYFAENGISTNHRLVSDLGDFRIADYFEIEEITHRNAESGATILSLGGDHSVTYPIIRALGKNYPLIDILHIDAHADLYEVFQGDPYSHACPFARIMEEKLANRLVQVGIRTLSTHHREQAARFGVEVNEMRNINDFRVPVFENPVYISIDLDGFDPGFAPGVSHHEPGGLNPRQVIGMIQSINSRIIGADIVEYNPLRDVQQITGELAAKLLKEIIGKILETQSNE